MKTRILPLLIAAALASGTASASEPAKAPKAAIEHKATRAEIECMVERMGPEGGRFKIERDERSFAPQAFKRGPGLGIVMAPNPAAAGVRIVAVTPESPAYKAGLRTDDVLLSVDGKTIAGSGTAAVENARTLLGKLKQDQVVKLRYARQGKSFNADVKADEIRRVFAFNRSERAPGTAGGEGEHYKRMMMLPPGVELEIERMGPMKECRKGDEDCGLPAIYQAFRWQGLNLSSIDAGLARYFGSDKGVLVLSSGPELRGLQSGDVIQRVGGKAVESPRDVMRALRDEDAGSQLKLDVLRDRKATAVTVTVPKSRPLPFMEPAPAPRAMPGVAPVPPVPAVAPIPPVPRASTAPRAPDAWDEV